MSATKVTPEVLWAQRSSATDPAKNYLYFTITVPDVPKSSLKLDITSTGLTFAGHSDSLKKDYALDVTFYAEIDEKETKINHTSKNVQLVLRKKELNEEFWPRLFKEAKKVHYLKTDFDKWVDEDEQEEAPEDDLGAMGGMGGMPGMGGAGGMDMASMMGGMGGAGGDFGGIDFSKLGSMGGGMEGIEGDDDDEEGEDDDDDDMPALESEEAGASKTSSKIEEIN